MGNKGSRRGAALLLLSAMVMRRGSAPILGGISLLWGSGWLLAPALANAAQPYAAGALSFGLAASLLFVVSAVQRKPFPPLPFQDGVLLLGGPQLLLILAGAHGAGGWTPLLYAFLPLFLALPEGTWTPAMAAAPACVLILLNGVVPFAGTKPVWALPALAAVAMQAAALRRLARFRGTYAIAPTLALLCAVACPVLGIASLFGDPSPRVTPRLASLLPFALRSVLGIALPYAGLLALLRPGALTPAQAATTPWLQTLLAVGESALFLRARPSSAVLLAALALLGCCWSVLRKKNS